jgi:multidrug resistance protein, MATE family
MPNRPTPSIPREAMATMRLGVPLMFGQLSQMLLGVADTLMVGHLGVTALAALTFATALFHVPLVFGIGVLTSVAVFTSNARGADCAKDARESCRNGLWLGVVLGVVLFALAVVAMPFFHLLGQPPDAIAAAKGYYLYVMFSLIPAHASFALKNHADALNRPWPPFWIFLGGVVLNVFLNWLLIYGKWGFPAMGLDGAGLATLLSRIAILVAMFIWMLRDRDLTDWVPRRRWFSPCRVWLRKLSSVGFPASIQMLCEVTAFSVAGLFMGHFGSTALAAHQVAITLAATAFMIPLGMSMALTVRVGEAVGAEETPRLRAIAVSGWMMVAGYAACTASVFLGFGTLLSSWFVEAQEVITLTAGLLVIVGLFQIVDGLQVASSSMLRGLQDTKIAAWMGFVSYWLIGLPMSYILAFPCGFGPRGVWWGLATGLGIACITLGFRLHRRIVRFERVRL